MSNLRKKGECWPIRRIRQSMLRSWPMLKPCPTAFGLPLLIATALSHAQAEEPSCQRLVEFRDGSILRVDLPAKYQFQFRELAEKNVDLVNTTVPLSLGEIQSVRFSKLPVFKQLKKIKSAIGSLGSDDFRVRDRAMRRASSRM